MLTPSIMIWFVYNSNVTFYKLKTAFVNPPIKFALDTAKFIAAKCSVYSDLTPIWTIWPVVPTGIVSRLREKAFIKEERCV